MHYLKLDILNSSKVSLLSQFLMQKSHNINSQYHVLPQNSRENNINFVVINMYNISHAVSSRAIALVEAMSILNI